MKNKFLKTLALASTMLFGASANALSISYDIIGDVSVKYSPTSGTHSLSGGAMLMDGSSFTLTPPANGALFTDYGHIKQANAIVVDSFDISDPLAPKAIKTTYTFSANFDNWKGEYYNVTTSGGDVTSYDATFTSGDVVWDLTTTVVTTDILSGVAGLPASDTDYGVLTMKIVEGVGDMAASGNTLAGDSTIVFEVVDVADDLIFLDVNGDGNSEDLAILLDNLSTEDEGFYLSVVNSTNTVIDTSDIDNVVYYQEMLALLFNSPLNALGYVELVGGVYALTALGVSDLQVQSFIANNAGQVYFATVAEPATLGMMSLALLGLAGFQRRRKNNS